MKRTKIIRRCILGTILLVAAVGGNRYANWVADGIYCRDFARLLEINDTEAVLHALKYHPELARTEYKAWQPYWRYYDGPARSEWSETPLHRAASHGNARVVKALLKSEPDVNATGQEGQTPLHLVRTAEVAEMLIWKGANVNARSDDYYTPLHYARNVAVARVLLKAGADPNAEDEHGLRPLDVARDPAVIRLLRGVTRPRSSWTQFRTKFIALRISQELAAAWGLDGGVAPDPTLTPLGADIPARISKEQARRLIAGLRADPDTELVGTATALSQVGEEAYVSAIIEQMFPECRRSPEKKPEAAHANRSGRDPSLWIFGEPRDDLGTTMTVTANMSPSNKTVILELCSKVVELTRDWDDNNLQVFRNYEVRTKVHLQSGQYVLLNASMISKNKTMAAIEKGARKVALFLVSVDKIVQGNDR